MSSETRITVSEICEALNADAKSLAPRILQQRPVQQTSREMRFFPKGGLRVSLSGAKRGIWKDYGTDESGDMLDLYQWATGCSKRDAVQWAKGELGIVDDAPTHELPKRDRAQEEKERKEEITRRKRAARMIWARAKSAKGTVAEDYLAGRGIRLPDSKHVGARHLDRDAMQHMGLTEAFPEPEKELDALIVLATGPEGEVAAVQQVILDGPKKAELGDTGAKKRTNGLMQGAAVKLGTPDKTLAMAEGPETGMSIHQATGLATWIVLGLYNFTQVVVPDSVEEIVIAVDVDETGVGLAQAVYAAGHWQAQGKRVRLAVPNLPEGDFNDLLTREGEDAVRRDIDNAITSVAVREDGPMVICERPADALAIWRSTGLHVRATVKPLENRILRLLDEVDRAIVVGKPAEPVKLDPKEVRHGTQVFEITTSHLTVDEVFQKGGADSVVRLMRTSVTLGKRIPYGLESIALKPDARVLAVPGKRAMRAARRLFPDDAVIAWQPQLDRQTRPRGGTQAVRCAYGWTAVRGREVVLAPEQPTRGTPAGVPEIAAAARAMLEAGARDVRVMRWPTCAPGPGGWRSLRRTVPAGYGFDHALGDGWTATRAKSLLDMAVPVPDGAEPEERNGTASAA